MDGSVCVMSSFNPQRCSAEAEQSAGDTCEVLAQYTSVSASVLVIISAHGQWQRYTADPCIARHQVHAMSQQDLEQA